MDEFLNNFGVLDWILFYVIIALLGLGSVLRIISNLQEIRLKRLELGKPDLENLHPEGEICPAVQRIAEVIPDLCPQCSRLLKWKCTQE